MNNKALYAAIDIKSFYASCECVARGLSIFDTPLVVLDVDRGPSTISLSATPYLKERYHVPNVCRRKDLPKIDGLIYAKPRMAYYIEISAQVVSIFLDYVSEEDLHVYSIDESFLNIGPYLKLAKKSPEEFVSEIQKRIKDELGLTATAGIGPNMFLAKVAMDNEGKKKAPYIAHWEMDDVPNKLWKISLITKIWGINKGISSHLSRIGIRTVEELAKADPLLLKKEFGIIGKELKDLANGIDRSDIREKYIPKDRNLSTGQTLHEDYFGDGAKIIIREMVDDLTSRMRSYGEKSGGVSLFVGYSSSVGGGFSHQESLLLLTDDAETLYEAIMDIFDHSYDGSPIRNIGISYFGLKKNESDQLSLLEDPEESLKRKNLQMTLDDIWGIYGRNSCLRATSLLKESTVIERHKQIGGHNA